MHKGGLVICTFHSVLAGHLEKNWFVAYKSIQYPSDARNSFSLLLIPLWWVRNAMPWGPVSLSGYLAWMTAWCTSDCGCSLSLTVCLFVSYLLSGLKPVIGALKGYRLAKHCTLLTPRLNGWSSQDISSHISAADNFKASLTTTCLSCYFIYELRSLKLSILHEAIRQGANWKSS